MASPGSSHGWSSGRLRWPFGNTRGQAPVILQSDRGSQLTSGDYQRFLGSDHVV
ncbi:unnamed protein product, partial [Ectocarpus sp. 12 AP-2014]